MKKHIIYLIFISASIFMSCDDELARNPIDQLDESTAYKNVSDLEKGLNGAIGNWDIRLPIRFNSIFTDNTKIGNDNGGQRLALYNQLLDVNNGGDQNIWDNLYQSINNLNRVIVASKNITPLTNEVTEYNNILGQCYALRAYMHAELLVYYGLDMTDPNAGAIYYQKVVETSGTPGRSTTAEVLVDLNADLDKASTLITNTNINNPTADFITFLKARLALYTGDYANAITYANGLIAKYPLANRTQYAQMFNDDNFTEVIFNYNNVQGSTWNIAGNWIFTGTGGSFMELSNSLYNALETGDVRKTIAITPASDPANNILDINKYPAGADTNYINDFKAMRISEMYLIRAEAQARKASPDFALAAADVQAIRVARYITAPGLSVYTNLNQAITDIKLERRRELSLEGHRYIDIKRYRNILNEGITRDAIDCGGSVPCNLPATSHKFTFPIPDTEVNANPTIAAQQAPGY